MAREITHRDYTLSDDKTRLDFAAIHAYLTRSYWSPGIPRDVVERAADHSFCVGIYAPDGAQVGYLRAITDYATFAYYCDVYVLEEHRGRRLAKAGVRYLIDHPRLQNLRALRLVTRDAHTLYEPFGFTAVQDPANHLEKRDPHVYLRRGE
jgi:GNAT superfamily N-acetyltransferase